jgi:hypothetical protein
MRTFWIWTALVTLFVSPWLVLVGTALAIVAPNGFPGVIMALTGLVLGASALEHLIVDEAPDAVLR